MTALRSAGICWSLLLAWCWSAAAQVAAPVDPFAGFPPINKFRPGDRSTKVIASDPVQGLLRPKWTRAMGDMGGWPNMFRFNGTIYLYFSNLDAHRGKRLEGTGTSVCYASKDEGQTWSVVPTPSNGAGESAVGDGKILQFTFNGKTRATDVRISTDGTTWSEPRRAYESPYWLYGATYDPVSKRFWCATQSMGSERDVRLLSSQDGLQWDHISTLPIKDVNISEAVLRFEADRTMDVIVRRKWSGDYCTLAVARPPYVEWKVSGLPEVAEGQSFFEAGGQVFLGSRAYLRDEVPEISANKSLRYVSAEGVAYSIIHRFTPERKLIAWAVMDSMGDCAYPRFVETPTEILVAYYSEHQDNVCKTYLAAFDKQEFLAPLPAARTDFTGYPALGKLHPGRRSADVLTSDAVPVGLRPKWTRAMADFGSAVNLYRFQGDLHFDCDNNDAQRRPGPESKAGTTRYVSKDDGQTWQLAPSLEDSKAGQSVVPLNDKLFRYDFDGAHSWVQMSVDGAKWSNPEQAYKPPFRLYGAIYDVASKLYWCPAHGVPGKSTDEREVHLINSKDGIHWDYVSTVASAGLPKTGEAVLHFEPDGTAEVVIRCDEGNGHYHAIAKPPFKDWTLSGLPEISEGQSFCIIGDRTYLASLANYTGDNPAVKDAPHLFAGRRPYTAIYRLAKGNREFLRWTVLDSVGDCSSPRLVETATEVLCAYCSQHQDGVCKPYLAAFDKKEFLRKR